MRLKLTLNRPGDAGTDDLLLTVDTTATVGEVADEIARRDPRGPGEAGDLTLRVDNSSDAVVLPADATLADTSLRAGSAVSLVTTAGRFREDIDPAEVAGSVTVLEGPDQGARFPLRIGANTIGREAGNDVVLSDPLVSKRHARLTVGDVLEIVDVGSSNGVVIEGEAVARSVIAPATPLLLGDTLLEVSVRTGLGGARGPVVEFVRPPRLDPRFEGRTHLAPQPPDRPQRQSLPLIPLIAPVVLGCVMFAVTRQLVTVLFVAMSPVLMLGSVIEARMSGRKAFAAATAAFRDRLEALVETLRAGLDEERVTRLAEHPSALELHEAVLQRTPLLWARRPDKSGFLEIRLGIGPQPSRTEVEITHTEGDPDLTAELLEVRDGHATVEGVPVVADLREVGCIGVAGPRDQALATARALMVQATGLHSPAEVVVAAVASPVSARDWEWLKWLPHVGGDQSPLTSSHLASSAPAAVRLVAELEDLVEARKDQADGPPPLPAVIVLVEDDAPVERSRLVSIAEEGREAGVHLVWVAPTPRRLPAACRAFLDLREDGSAVAGFVDGSVAVAVNNDVLRAGDAELAARALSPVIDAGARVRDESDLPTSASLLSLAGNDAASSTDHVLDRWRMSGSLPTSGPVGRRRNGHNLRAIVGAAPGQSFVLDLREHGPHALVGGTTGSGKSEFLQSWVVGMALEHSAARVTFLFVDYKGGAAFSECVHLPHSVGLVTDLSPHLVRRALESLDAELRHREHVLREKKAKDLLELERRGDPDTPPSLVIVVDEFAALVAEVPEFVDGVVNVAQRGRSLGLHLVLATQRPAGVIKDNLRANTNLRIALRVADAADSEDVIGVPDAAAFDPGTPGRALAKAGPGRLTAFQSAYVGGWTSDTPPKPAITIEELGFGRESEWEAPAEEEEDPAAQTGPNDLHRIVHTIASAHKVAGLPAPRRPWLESLAAVYDLARAPLSRTDRELIWGIRDEPSEQRQTPVAFLPDRDGNMAVYGTGGTGKTAFLRTLAIVAGLSRRGGPCHVYALDFGARGLQSLEELPHVGAIIPADDEERIQRLLRQLRDTIDERGTRYAKVNASTITEYRTASGERDEPRILLLVDNLAAFRSAFELGPNSAYFDLFQTIAADGRRFGVHVVVSADRAAAVPAALASVLQQRLVLRLASENDFAMLGIPLDAFDAQAPPGRGYIEGTEVQVLVLGGTSNTSRQAAAITQLAAQLEETGNARHAPKIERLAERVRLGDLPKSIRRQPVIGVADDDLQPLAFVPEDVLLVVGPPQSGRTSVMASLALALERNGRGDLVYLGGGRSPLRTLGHFTKEATSSGDIEELARSLTPQIEAGDSGLGAVFLEDVSSFAGSSSELDLQDLVRACRTGGVLFVTDSETSALASWPLQLAVKAPRHGIILQPDQMDGESVFRTALPRVSRRDFPPGRGFYVRGGRARRFQAALPEIDSP